MSYNKLFFLINKEKNYYKYFLKIFVTNLSIFLIFIKLLAVLFGKQLNNNPWYNNNHMMEGNTSLININNLYKSENSFIIYTRDKYGFRGKYNDVSKINILTLGGSTTDQRYVSDSLTFQSILARKFRNNNQNISVVNAGIDGQSTVGNLNNFSIWFPIIEGLKVEYFLFYVGINDFHILSSENPDFRNSDSFNIKNRHSLKHKSPTAIDTFIFGLLNLLDAFYYSKKERLHHEFNFEKNTINDNLVEKGNIKDYKVIMEEDLVEYENRLILLCEEVKKLNAKAIFVTQARNVYKFIDQKLYGVKDFGLYKEKKISGVDYYHMIRLMHEVCEDVSKKNNAVFLDLNRDLKFDYDLDFYDDMHTTPSGSEKIGEYIYSKIKNLKFKL